MDRDQLRAILEEVRANKTSVDEAMDRVRLSALEELGFATLDIHRALRRGFPEVVYGPGKTPEQIAKIVQRIHEAGQTVLVTRVSEEAMARVRQEVPDVEHHERARALVLRPSPPRPGRPGVVVVSAGTSDGAVAEEAALTAELMGNEVERIEDVGVAGLHRLMAHRQTLLKARVIVAVAGMEGALPSVVAGLTDCPVIGVPTSVGYGAGAHGQARPAGHAQLLLLRSDRGQHRQRLWGGLRGGADQQSGWRNTGPG